MALESKNEKTEKHLYTVIRETGCRVARVDTFVQGLAKIEEYEKTDKEQGDYAPDSYSVIETERTSIWVVMREDDGDMYQLGYAWDKETACDIAERIWSRMGWSTRKAHHQDLHIYQYIYDFETDLSAKDSFTRAEYTLGEFDYMDVDEVIDYGDIRWAEEKAEEEKELKESERQLAD